MAAMTSREVWFSEAISSSWRSWRSCSARSASHTGSAAWVLVSRCIGPLRRSVGGVAAGSVCTRMPPAAPLSPGRGGDQWARRTALLPMRLKLLASTLLCLLPAAPAACGGSSAAVPSPGLGLVVVPADPADRGVAPEALEARGVRSYFHDFGRVPLGDKVQHVFQLENTDPRPVTVTRMQAS